MRLQRFSVAWPKRMAWAVVLALLVMASCGRPQREEKSAGGSATAGDTAVLMDEVRLPATPVKQQGRSPLCWVYAMLATIETEHLVRGDSVNLSPVYLARQWLCEQGERYFLTQGSEPLSMRGMSTMALHLINKYGIHPYDYYHGHDDVNWNVLARRVTRLADAARSRRHSLDRFRLDLQDLLDRETGYMPRYVHMLGAEYTSQEFGRSVCMTDEYEALTSFAHHPYGERFALEVADNQLGDTFLNVPLDTLMAVIERSLRAGHPVCWEGDITEDGFSLEQGVACVEGQEARGRSAMPLSERQRGKKGQEKSLEGQEATRQREFETFQTTDDHCMALVGLARDRQGRRYYLAKNSWGGAGRYGGYLYLSEDYVRMKTICVIVHRDQLQSASLQ